MARDPTSPAPTIRKKIRSIDLGSTARDGVFLLPLLLFGLGFVFSKLVPPFQGVFNREDPLLRFPYAAEETVNTVILIIVAAVYPAVVLLVWAWWCKFNLKHMVYTVNAFLLALTWTFFITYLLQVLTGKFRPDFLDRCKPVRDGNAVGGFRCTGDEKLVSDGRRSFPSSHASLTFAGGVFLVLFLYGTMQAKTRRNAWILTFLLGLLVPALWVAFSRFSDYRNHTEDVIVGFFIGTFFAYLWYTIYFQEPKPDDGYTHTAPTGAPFIGDGDSRNAAPRL
ncbi:phosphatidic acid phosphatase type 2/haloperoxidase [Catenaria anguillulae PL171]|uniref:Phosphatidic acid phosphatase type 2/haloperoxidase n=1 Tax=Catenaria anguillulae PL171 TaxID=765915 RepID=A0A1Y2HT62_9FUNG|nr:phosphatidic acid phosphatase type 2/haloperoxidase [Catenaria anguillulae PL171]